MLISAFTRDMVVYSEVLPLQIDSFWILLGHVLIFLNIFDLWEPMDSLFLLSRKYRNSSE